MSCNYSMTETHKKEKDYHILSVLIIQKKYNNNNKNIENYIVIIIFVATAECTFLVKILQGFSGINLSQPRFIGASCVFLCI